MLEGATFLTALWTNDQYFLDEGQLTAGTWSLSGLKLVQKAGSRGIVALALTTSSTCWPIAPLELPAFTTLVELCLGIGGISWGCRPLQGRVLASVDLTALACDMVLLNGGFAIQGDIASGEVLLQVHQATAGSPCAVTAGFPCQPYSMMGSGGGLSDERGQVLQSVPRTAWRLQASAIVFECVSEITSYSTTMELLHAYARQVTGCRRWCWSCKINGRRGVVVGES